MILEYLKSIRSGLESLVFDSSCIICGDKTSQFCLNCRKEWRSNPMRLSGEDFPVYSSITYGETAATIVLMAKESGISLTRELLVQELRDSIKELCIGESTKEKNIILVPIPSSRRARVRRGIDFISQISRATAYALNQESEAIKFRSSSILSLKRRVVDQTSLSECGRRENLSGAFTASSKSVIKCPIIIVDDVITTGSTLREAARALKERNLTVLGAATACASQRRLPIR